MKHATRPWTAAALLLAGVLALGACAGPGAPLPAAGPAPTPAAAGRHPVARAGDPAAPPGDPATLAGDPAAPPGDPAAGTGPGVVAAPSLPGPSPAAPAPSAADAAGGPLALLAWAAAAPDPILAAAGAGRPAAGGAQSPLAEAAARALAAAAELDDLALAAAVADLRADPAAARAGARLQEAVAAALKALRARYPGSLAREKVVYLTFDDGPDPAITPQVLAILADQGVRATFFVIGGNAAAHPDLVRQAARAGHALGNHTYTHRYADIYASPEAFMASLAKTDRVLADLTGRGARVVRAPGGSYNKFSRRTLYLLEQAGYVGMDWNVDSEDAKGANTPAAILERVKRDAAGKAPVVLLMHDAAGKTATVAALPEIIAYFREQGYTFAVLDGGGHGYLGAVNRGLLK